MFHTHGLPLTIRSDNRPPFSSVQFAGFLDHLGIVHKKGTVYWPQSNCKFERCNETILKMVRIAQLEGTDWKKVLQDLLSHYRTTPHTLTGLPSAELLMGRRLNDKLPRVIIPKGRITDFAKEMYVQNSHKRSMRIASVKQSTMTLRKGTRSSSTKAVRTNYRQSP